jgi:Ca-activated chloride channel homolog
VRLLEVVIVPLFLSGAAAAYAPAGTYAQFTSGVNLVEVYATVTDGRGEPVTGLTAADFRIAEDGAPQTVSTFAPGAFPLSIAIGIDRSFSMGGRDNRLAVAKSAARTLVGALRPEDQVMIVAIGGDTAIVAPLSADRTSALAAIDRLDVWGSTPLYDATLAALDAIEPARGRRALVLLSDGADRDSATTAGDLVQGARARDVLTYPVAIGAMRPPVFAELAAATGGRSFFVRDPAALHATMTAIARELRFQYLLGYVPSRERAGEPSWHAIEVTVRRADVRVRARDGYFSR